MLTICMYLPTFINSIFSIWEINNFLVEILNTNVKINIKVNHKQNL